MPKLVHAARASTPADAVWRACAGCGALAALPPEVDRCPHCAGGWQRQSGGSSARALERRIMAALVEIASTCAATARLIAKRRHFEPRHVASLVSDPTDAYVVLGHGKWSPNKTTHAPVSTVDGLAVAALVPELLRLAAPAVRESATGDRDDVAGVAGEVAADAESD